jgi:hypothetical protein
MKTNTFEDIEIVCHDCDTAFTWTSQEQKVFAERNLQQLKLCTEWRRAKRERDGAFVSNSGGNYGNY